MPRGVLAVGDRREEAEQQVLADAPHMQVLRSREIDFTGMPRLAGRPLPKHWTVVVQHTDPDEEAKLPQHEDPEEHCEREIRLLYLTMALDPDLLISGVTEEFPCPVCSEQIELDLPAPREGRPRTGAACPHCRTPLRREDERSVWKVAPPKHPRAATCVFCGARADSYEHVIPAWISKRLGIKSFLSADEAVVTGGAPRRRQSISFASYRARIFCGGCNEHFKQLEDAVIPLLVPMARGRTFSLNQESQVLLARWAHKTAIALVAAAYGAAGEPGDHSLIRFFNWRGGPLLGTAQPDIVWGDGCASPVHGYLAFLAFAQVGFCVTAFDAPVHANQVAELPELLQFWPTESGPLAWPPPSTDNRILPAFFGW